MSKRTEAITLYQRWRSEGVPTLITGQEAQNLSIATIGVIADGLKRKRPAINLSTVAQKVAAHKA